METITFSEHSLPINSQVTNQFANLGVTFSPTTYYDNEPNGAHYPNFSGDYITNFTPGGAGSSYVNPVTINFTSVVTGAAFAMAADGTPYRFTAELNGNVVDQMTVSVTYNVSQDFFGFQNEKFNSIVVTAGRVGWRSLLRSGQPPDPGICRP